MSVYQRVLRAVPAVVLALGFIAGGCGDDSDSNASTGSNGDGLTPVTVGFIPIASYAMVWHAEESGYFEDAGLDVELEVIDSGASAVPSLERGDLDFITIDVVSAMQAVNAGAELEYVSLEQYSVAESSIQAVVTLEPTEPQDLAGKDITCSPHSLNIDDLLLREWLSMNDVDPDSINCVDLPFTEMLPALEAGTVDAAALVEPQITVARDKGHHVVADYFTDVRSPVNIAGFLSTSRFIEENEDVTESFVTALNRAIDDFNADDGVARDVIVEHTELEAELANEMNLPLWRTVAVVEDLEFWVDIALEYGAIDEEIDPTSILWSGLETE